MLQKLWNCWQPYQPCRTTLRRSSLPTTKRATPSWVLCCRITMPSIRSPWSPAVRHHGILWEIVWNRHGDMVNVGGLWVCSRLQNLKFGPLNFGSELIHPFKIIKIMCLRLSIQSHNGTSWYVLVRVVSSSRMQIINKSQPNPCCAMCIFHQLCGVNSAEAKGLTWFTPGEDQSLISAAMLKAACHLGNAWEMLKGAKSG